MVQISDHAELLFWNLPVSELSEVESKSKHENIFYRYGEIEKMVRSCISDL